jgi:hypothetical protein
LLSSFSIDQFSVSHPISLTGLRLLRINVMLILLHLEPESAVPHISLVFGEMWDTTNLNLQPSEPEAVLLIPEICTSTFLSRRSFSTSEG